MGRRSLSKTRIQELVSKLRQQPIWDLHKKKDREDVEVLLKGPEYRSLDVHLYGVLDYRAYYTLRGEQRRELYYVFIDVRNCTIKTRVCDYLNAKKIASLNLASDMDIVAVVLATTDGIKEFREDISRKFPECEFHTYALLRPLFIEKYRVRTEGRPDISDLDLSPNAVSRIQANYADKALKKDHALLTAERVLIGHSVLYDFVELGELRDVALIFNVQTANEDQFRTVHEIREHIVDLYEVYYHRPFGYGSTADYTSFYASARYLAVLEFAKASERDIWEKMVGTVFPNSNVFFFPVSAIVCAGPYGITDIEFDGRCNQYSAKETLPIGHPVRNGDPIDSLAGLGVYSVNKNGCIMGLPRHGKTTTAIRLIKGFVSQKWATHVVNATADLQEELKKAYGANYSAHQLAELSGARRGFADFSQLVQTFSLDRRMSDDAQVDLLISAIKRTPQVKPVPIKHSAVKTKDNPVKSVLILDEAHDLLAGAHSEAVIRRFANILQKVSHHGIAVYFITQEVSHLRRGGESIIPLLGNRIFHRMPHEEAESGTEMLLPPGAAEDSVYGKIKNELPELPVGRVFVRFMTQDGEPMPPLKLQVLWEQT